MKDFILDSNIVSFVFPINVSFANSMKMISLFIAFYQEIYMLLFLNVILYFLLFINYVVDNYDDAKLWMFIDGKALELLTYVVIMVLYTKMKLVLRKKACTRLFYHIVSFGSASF